ncbi:Uncharacterised protein [Vibrio cholerae]|nr:Uncharacterised protein [Vibrio cholerae]
MSQQLFLNAFFKRNVDHRAAVTATAKLHQSHTIIRNADQTNVATMAGQLRVDLGLQGVFYALHQRGIVRNFAHFRVRGFQGQL